MGLCTSCDLARRLLDTFWHALFDLLLVLLLESVGVGDCPSQNGDGDHDRGDERPRMLRDQGFHG